MNCHPPPHTPSTSGLLRAVWIGCVAQMGWRIRALIQHDSWDALVNPSPPSAEPRTGITSTRRGQDARLQASGRACHDPRFRPPCRRTSDKGCHPQPLRRTRNTRYATRRIGLSKGRGSRAFRGFVPQSPVAKPRLGPMVPPLFDRISASWPEWTILSQPMEGPARGGETFRGTGVWFCPSGSWVVHRSPRQAHPCCQTPGR